MKGKRASAERLPLIKESKQSVRHRKSIKV